MIYPDSYCIKCKKHTETLAKHTVVLGNNRRALKGVCPVCATETYRFMPNKDEKSSAPALSVISSLREADRRQPSFSAAASSARQYPLRYERSSSSQEIFYYGCLFVVLGVALGLGFLVIFHLG